MWWQNPLIWYGLAVLPPFVVVIVLSIRIVFDRAGDELEKDIEDFENHEERWLEARRNSSCTDHKNCT